MGDFDRNAGRRSSSRFGGRDRGSGGFGGRDRGSSGGFDRRDRGSSSRFGGRDRRPEMHEAICDKCGNDCEVPFRPTEGKPIYCDDCFKDKSKEAGSRSEMGRPINNEKFDQINSKLDKILKLLGEKPVKDKPKNKEKIQQEFKKQKGLEKDIEEAQPDSEEPKLEYAESIKKPKKKSKKKK